MAESDADSAENPTKGMFRSRVLTLQPDWIDYNGHLNMAYYNVLFDHGYDDVFELIGMGPDYTAIRKLTIYTAESHVRYIRELHLGDEVEVFCRILDHDEKRIHAWQELRHRDGWLSATSETMTLHVDMNGPKVAPFPDEIADRLEALAAQHRDLPYPEDAGRPIEIRRKQA